MILLLWVYYSAQIFLVGAEFTWVYAHTFGSLKGQPMAEAVPEVAAAADAAPVRPRPALPAASPAGAPAPRGPLKGLAVAIASVVTLRLLAWLARRRALRRSSRRGGHAA